MTSRAGILRRFWPALLVLPIIVVVAASSRTRAARERPLSIWVSATSNGTGNVYRQIAKEFADQPGGVPVEFTAMPVGAYNDQVTAAVLADELPDLLMTDGPNVANYVWSGYLRPLDDLVDSDLVDDLLPSIRRQGTYPPDGRLYCIGATDAGLSLLGNRRLLLKAGMRIPRGLEDAWTREEFEEGLARLKALPEISYPLDLKLTYGAGEWFTHAYSPFVQAFGGDLIDRSTWQASGTLDGAASVGAVTMLQEWYAKGWVVPASAGEALFYASQSAALSWIANWGVRPAQQTLGADLLVLPPPRFATGQVTALGSWCFAITRRSERPAEAARLLSHIMRTENIERLVEVAGYPPARYAAVARSPAYAPGAPLALYIRQLETIAVERPRHPAYPIITNAFAEALDNVFNGADPQSELTRAARRIDRDIEENAGYPPFGRPRS